MNYLMSAKLKYLVYVALGRPGQEDGHMNIVCIWLSWLGKILVPSFCPIQLEMLREGMAQNLHKPMSQPCQETGYKN